MTPHRRLSPAVVLFFTLVLLGSSAATAGAHCEIPCGIYNDELRADLIAEHATTIEKSMQMITTLSAATTPGDHNQLARWVINKETHSEAVQEIVWQYFLTQRIKPDADKYTEKVTLLHQMLVAAMKCKQTVDPAHVDTLRKLLKAFRALYFDHSHKS